MRRKMLKLTICVVHNGSEVFKGNAHTTVSLRCGDTTQVCTAEGFKQRTYKSGRAYFLKKII